jgi:hypothetical protein
MQIPTYYPNIYRDDYSPYSDISQKLHLNHQLKLGPGDLPRQPAELADPYTSTPIATRPLLVWIPECLDVWRASYRRLVFKHTQATGPEGPNFYWTGSACYPCLSVHQHAIPLGRLYYISSIARRRLYLPDLQATIWHRPARFRPEMVLRASNTMLRAIPSTRTAVAHSVPTAMRTQ